jgi:hypothetical protein
MAKKKEALRSALTDAPFVLVMKPSGAIVRAPYAKNLRGGPIEFVEGKPRLRPKFADRGYRLFDDIATPDQVEFWERYVKEGSKARGRIKIAKVLVDRMRPKVSADARKAWADGKHQRVEALEILAGEKAEPKVSKRSDPKAEPKD